MEKRVFFFNKYYAILFLLVQVVLFSCHNSTQTELEHRTPYEKKMAVLERFICLRDSLNNGDSIRLIAGYFGHINEVTLTINFVKLNDTIYLECTGIYDWDNKSIWDFGTIQYNDNVKSDSLSFEKFIFHISECEDIRFSDTIGYKRIMMIKSNRNENLNIYLDRKSDKDEYISVYLNGLIMHYFSHSAVGSVPK